MAGIYIHIPFCRRACHYCDFHFSTNHSIQAELVRSISNELAIQKDYLQHEVINTIYFGGGTPSLLTLNQLDGIFNTIYKNFNIQQHPEVTLECNPDDLSISYLEGLKDAGINRLSIGIQSFDDRVLQFLNRAHDSKAAVDAVRQARQTGFENISLDLIYAIPGQDHAAWKKNITVALSLEPVHISSYALTIEEKTAFGRWASKGKLIAVEDDAAATELEILMDILEAAGFDQYEISNFGKPGFYSQHNSSYWKQAKYLGVGPSAHSFNGEGRQFNVPNNHLYIKAIERGEIPAEYELLSKEDQINEFLLTTLRTHWGCNLKKLKDLYGYDLFNDHSKYLHELIKTGRASLKNDVLFLERPGKLLADRIASDLFLIKE